MEISHSDIDGKICKTENGHRTPDSQKSYGTYALETDRSSEDVTATALCRGKGGNNTTQGTVYQFKDFVANALKEGNKNWPTSKEKEGAKAVRENVKSTQNDNAKAVADDLTKKLSSEEKTIVAGLLAKTIEGGEVVERCLSTST
ncbi:hypothetical protein ANAPC3_01408 [Anaplasma phagocytophilum]|nr:hypothetical protein ANAPC4_01097 [Anaplasma phagocytophilum]SBO33914.1 hypothetical protein ANAPC3_01408 [Anaplasma phagocytophilum]